MRKCRITNRWKDRDGNWHGDGLPCQEPATYEVHDLGGKVTGKCCPKHGKETELLILGTNAYITARFMGNN